MADGNFQALVNETIDKVNQLKRFGFNVGDEVIEILQTVSILLNALKRYSTYLETEKKSDLSYAVELLRTAKDSLVRAIRLLEKRK